MDETRPAPPPASLGEVLRRALGRGVLSGALLGTVAAAGLHIAGDEVPGLLPFSLVGGLVIGAVIGLLAAAAAAGVLVLGYRRVGSRVLAGSAAGAAAAVSGALWWFAGLGRAGGQDLGTPTTLIVLVVSLVLASWHVQRLRAKPFPA
ncbi:hypothetical protein [Actinotalea sp. C106]|uniref:hypothetical protein n=1 Tax=Actinotalea sp. C106 TaxID=2908644 RepID=UPI00202776C5|nr:hypothetical protein [Actinotalea sp. C106]